MQLIDRLLKSVCACALKAAADKVGWRTEGAEQALEVRLLLLVRVRGAREELRELRQIIGEKAAAGRLEEAPSPGCIPTALRGVHGDGTGTRRAVQRSFSFVSPSRSL